MSVLSKTFQKKIGINLNSSIIDFCKESHDFEFHCANYTTFLDSAKDNSIDCIFALDIYTNIFPILLLKLAKRKLKKDGHLVMSERENNQVIYKRLLLQPFLHNLTRESNNRITPLSRFNERMNRDDRDNFIVVFQKREY